MDKDDKRRIMTKPPPCYHVTLNSQTNKNHWVGRSLTTDVLMTYLKLGVPGIRFIQQKLRSTRTVTFAQLE